LPIEEQSDDPQASCDQHDEVEESHDEIVPFWVIIELAINYSEMWRERIIYVSWM